MSKQGSLSNDKKSVPVRAKYGSPQVCLPQVPSFCHQQACELQHTKQHSSENRRNHNTLLGLLPIESKIGPHNFGRQTLRAAATICRPRDNRNIWRGGGGAGSVSRGCVRQAWHGAYRAPCHTASGVLSPGSTFFNLVLLVNVQLLLQSLSMWLTTKTGQLRSTKYGHTDTE